MPKFLPVLLCIVAAGPLRAATTFGVPAAGLPEPLVLIAYDGVTYLVSGGGGATPYDVDRTASDRYQSTDFPNYHYVRFELRGQTLIGEMIRLDDYAAPSPAKWRVRDRFEISLRP
ncbi:MAG TPA: hypothetical protein VGH12_08740 [Steroidobacteraceae bacterium]